MDRYTRMEAAVRKLIELIEGEDYRDSDNILLEDTEEYELLADVYYGRQTYNDPPVVLVEGSFQDQIHAVEEKIGEHAPKHFIPKRLEEKE